MKLLRPAWTSSACWFSRARVQLTPAQIEAREIVCPWCGRQIGVRPGRDGKTAVPRHKRSEK